MALPAFADVVRIAGDADRAPVVDRIDDKIEAISEILTITSAYVVEDAKQMMRPQLYFPSDSPFTN